MTSQKINPKVVWVAALGGFITLLAPSLVEHLQQWESGKARVLVVYPDKLAKPLGYIVGLGASIAAFWTAIKSGVSPK